MNVLHKIAELARGSATAARRALAVSLCLWLPVPAAVANDWIYSTRPGDNIWNLTERHLKSIGYWKSLQRYNGIENPRSMLPGTRLRIPIRWLRVQPASALLATVRGDVHRTVAGSGQSQPAVVGDRLNSGDGVRTGERSSATVQFADGSTLLVYAQTTLVLDSMSAYGTTGMVDTRMRLDRGRVESDVRPASGAGSRYRIITPTAVVAVRGTRFRTAYDDDAAVARGEVTQGEVGFDAGPDRQRLPAGFGQRAEPGKRLQPPVKLLPAPDLSGLPARAERVLVSLAWPAVEGAEAYRAQVLTPDPSGQLLLDVRVTGPGVDFDAPQDGQYRLRVRAIDERGLEGLDAESGLQVDARPIPPRLLGPADAAALLASEPPELWWSQPQGIERFHLQLTGDGGFQAPRLDLVVDGTRHAVSAELQPGSYSWRVASVAGDGERGPFSDPRTFKVQAVPDAATATSSVEEGRVTIGWERLANAARYEFQIARDERFSELLVDESLNALEFVLENPEAGTYYFRARGVSDEGVAGPYSPVNALEIPGEPLSPAWLLLLAPLLLL